ncbi:MAG: hypothetical protein CBC49_007180 [Alphaproteobacteria bacterium TMED89]|nr:hypothetical protein [Rhodospirillaceae bacterium]RPH13118.1 MAG: hypothetical protein CBC49_007180 [Alphaproteobacteria bacterium TMED89]
MNHDPARADPIGLWAARGLSFRRHRLNLLARSVPALTTISQPRLEIGRMAARMLLDRINGQSYREGLHPQLDVTLVVRESTAPLLQS